MKSQRRVLRFEGLERRALLSADLVNGVLTVMGTKKHDDIQISIPATGPHAGELEADVNGVQSFFNVADVSSIQVSGLKGNDNIVIDDDVLIDALISGGNGNDSIKGGGGNDTIHGDDGNDTVDGSTGDDSLYGDKGSDDLDGGVDDDFLDGGKGSDDLHGGDGDDLLRGGDGNDHLNGDDGNNLVDGGKGRHDDSNGLETNLDSQVKAVLAGIAGRVGEAKYETENDNGQLKSKFELEVHNCSANATLDVTIAGVVIGQVNTDNSGEAELKFSSNPSGGELAFPINFPALSAGTTISVGSELQATFIAEH